MRRRRMWRDERKVRGDEWNEVLMEGVGLGTVVGLGSGVVIGLVAGLELGVEAETMS